MVFDGFCDVCVFGGCVLFVWLCSMGLFCLWFFIFLVCVEMGEWI